MKWTWDSITYTKTELKLALSGTTLCQKVWCVNSVISEQWGDWTKSNFVCSGFVMRAMHVTSSFHLPLLQSSQVMKLALGVSRMRHSGANFITHESAARWLPQFRCYHIIEILRFSGIFKMQEKHLGFICHQLKLTFFPPTNFHIYICGLHLDQRK